MAEFARHTSLHTYIQNTYNKSWKLIRRQKVSKIIQQDANAFWQRRQYYNFPNLLSMTTTADSNSICAP